MYGNDEPRYCFSRVEAKRAMLAAPLTPARQSGRSCRCRRGHGVVSQAIGLLGVCATNL